MDYCPRLTVFNPADKEVPPPPDPMAEAAGRILDEHELRSDTVAGRLFVWRYKQTHGLAGELDRVTYKALIDAGVGNNAPMIVKAAKTLERARLLWLRPGKRYGQYLIGLMTPAPDIDNKPRPDRQKRLPAFDEPPPLTLALGEFEPGLNLVQTGFKPGLNPAQTDSDAHIKKRNKETNKQREEEEPGKPEEPLGREFLQAARELYQRLDPSHYEWVALAALVAVDQGHISRPEIDALVDDCKGADNFAEQLKARLGPSWMRPKRLKPYLARRGIPWKRKWLHAAKPQNRPP